MRRWPSLLLACCCLGCSDDASLPVDAGEVDAGPPSMPDAGAPPGVTVTVNDIPTVMNGSEPFVRDDGVEEPFRLLLPTHGFVVNVQLRLGGAPLADAPVSVRCEGPDGPLAAPCDGGELADGLVDGRSLEVTEAMAFPVAREVVLRATVTDAIGRTAQDALTVEIAERTPALDPFDAPETWLLTFDRDFHTIGSEVVGGRLVVNAEPTPNGVPDFLEDLAAVGLRSDDSAEGAAELVRDGRTGASAILEGLLVDATVAEMREHFDGVRIDFAVAGEPGAPDPSEFTEGGDFSILGFGGLGAEGDVAFGRALIDDHNQGQQDDSVYGLGIFTTTVARFLLTSALSADVVARFSPGLGTPIGMHPGDARILAEGYDRAAETDPEVAARAGDLQFILGLAPVGLAALASHEVGHSLGLVPAGAPPRGLFGGEASGTFIVGPSTDRHIDTRGLNMMQTGEALSMNPADIVTGTPHFYPLARAYLRRQLLYDPSR